MGRVVKYLLSNFCRVDDSGFLSAPCGVGWVNASEKAVSRRLQNSNALRDKTSTSVRRQKDKILGHLPARS
jgi:hypothetical protein